MHMQNASAYPACAYGHCNKCSIGSHEHEQANTGYYDIYDYTISDCMQSFFGYDK